TELLWARRTGSAAASGARRRARLQSRWNDLEEPKGSRQPVSDVYRDCAAPGRRCHHRPHLQPWQGRRDMFRTSRLSAGAAKANRPGFALESTLVVMILVGAIVALATTWVVTTQRTTGVDYRGARVQHAAEAGADAIMAQLELAMQDGVLRQTEIDALKTPELDGFDFEQLDVTYTGAAAARTIQSATFKGLFALNQPVEIAVSARDENM